jgi:putative transposase
MPVHIVSRGNNKECIFTDANDYERYLSLLADALERFGAQCHTYCLMWNHAHLEIRPNAFPVWRIMQQLNSSYCAWFNKRHSRVGHVLQGRYFSRLIEDGSYQLNTLRYIALNPVAARKVSRPEDWPWSSHRAAAGLCERPSFLDLESIACAFDVGTWDDARERYVMFVNAPAAIEDIAGPVFAGSAVTAARIDALIAPHRANDEFVYAERFATRASLESLLVGRSVGRDLDQGVWAAFMRHGYTLRELGELLNMHPATIWTWVRRASAKTTG